MVTIGLTDFGPIVSGKISLRPLTVFVGPNNTGKSYAARLVYAIMRSMGRRRRRAVGVEGHFLFDPDYRAAEPTNVSKEAREWLAETGKTGRPFAFREVPAELHDWIVAQAKRLLAGRVEDLSQEIQRCFGAKLASLTRTSSSKGFQLTLHQGTPPISIDLTSKGSALVSTNVAIDLESVELDPKQFRALRAPLRVDPISRFVLAAMSSGWGGTVYYFPAARSGILQGHKLLASMLLSRLPLLGIEPLDIPRLSGEVADFIGNMLRLERRSKLTEPGRVAKFIEARVCKGQLNIQAPRSKAEYPEIFYKTADGKFPLHGISSMISELAPVVVFLKHVVDVGDLLIIEEPEAHLHPVNQRIIAEALVKLVRCGVRVLVTTHSDYLLHQISNFIRLSAVESEDRRSKLGYGVGDYLNAGEVSAFLFGHDESVGGTMVRELAVTVQEGIPEDEHVKVAEELYDETLRLDRALQKEIPTEDRRQ